MKWLGESDFLKLLGLRGLKAIMLVLLDEINTLRSEAGLPERTIEQTITAVTNKHTSLSGDEEPE